MAKKDRKTGGQVPQQSKEPSRLYRILRLLSTAGFSLLTEPPGKGQSRAT